jgi:hypothetical protein
MVMNDNFKDFGKVAKKGYRPVVANWGALAFFESRNNSSLLPKGGKHCCDRLRLKMCLRTGRRTLEQPLIIIIIIIIIMSSINCLFLYLRGELNGHCPIKVAVNKARKLTDSEYNTAKNSYWLTVFIRTRVSKNICRITNCIPSTNLTNWRSVVGEASEYGKVTYAMYDIVAWWTVNGTAK